MGSIQKQITVFSGVLLHNNHILMVQRSEPELPDAHLKWEFPGGKVDFGETPQESLEREFLEETGRIIKAKQLLPFIQTRYWKYSWGTQQTLCFVFLCELVKEGDPAKVDHHVSQIKWIPMDEVILLDSLPGTEEVMSVLQTKL